MSRVAWTAEQLEYLRASYRSAAIADVVAATGHSARSVYAKAQSLGLARLRTESPYRSVRRSQAIDWDRLRMAFRAVCQRRRIAVYRAGCLAGVDTGSMSRWIHAKRGLSAVNVLVICHWAGLDPMAFLEDVTDLHGTPSSAAEESVHA